MNELQIFNNPEFGSIRTVEIDGEPWLVGKDVAAALGYSNPRDALAVHVDEEDKSAVAIHDGSQNRNMTIINESGLYSLVLSSKLPGAKKFKRWVTAEVLPSIRKTGGYAIPKDYPAALRALADAEEKRLALETVNASLTERVNVQQQQIAEMQPKASYYDVVLNCKDLVAISTIAKDYGWSANRMNTYLHEAGIQYKQGSIWLLYQKYAEQGYTSTKTHSYPGNDGEVHSKTHTYWTQKGRLFIYDLLKSDGVIPLMEQNCVA